MNPAKRSFGSVLNRILYPEGIRTLNNEELTALAEDLRATIIETVSRTGGHLASSLGAVELTLAVHKVFNTPQDKIIWDVGHQAYAHKLITGRADRFFTLRQKGGISGFPKREESPYDVFNVGHSSTSISAASGILEARDLKKEDFKVVAIIGDGSMTAGLSFEGLNWSGDRKKDLIIILNDNEMSISPNVGALSSYLNSVMTGQTVKKIRKDIKNFLKTIPSIGEQVLEFSKRAEESLKALIVPGALFEDLGFTYVGPLDGHRLDHLIRNLENVRNMEGPVLVHVITRKGKGYEFAEAEPLRFHGIGPFYPETGGAKTAGKSPAAPSYTQVFGQTLVQLARENPRIVAITAAMCEGTGLNAFAGEFPDRFFDVGIAEQHGVTFAAGLAVEGMIPVVAIYSSFLQRAYDQILHDVCLQNLPVVFALDRSGFVGEDGPTHHGLFDLAFLRSIPNLIVMAPKDENELQSMLFSAVSCGQPVAIRYPRGSGVGVPPDDEPRALEIGKGEVLSEGTDIAILAIGSTVYPALRAAERLREEGISAAVINARFVKPLDGSLLCNLARSFKNILTVEENVLMGGFGSAVLEFFEENNLRDIRVKRLGIRDEFAQHATQAELRNLYGIDERGIVSTVSAMMARKDIETP
ncbi:1-deoxy-D-xylulose-5-phosphate synthase [Syntrophus gentianae]|uniref:1-deoxy-D-xylulose-5-phosphate synthase n=1 Tax=Syntrophus gentianae TaxID=43775 RepID=A0A1H7WWI0_9BACT|nr:1-deoxy-D-xylulose-5-phosphate synthase [Syntrophus gentianae]SEM25936.1 1-deoxy-D-xylulose-5-phosphate synthase [Syntrophus gentianae]